MWRSVLDHCTTLLCVIIVVVPTVMVWKLNINENFMKDAEKAVAQASFFDAGILGVSIDRSIVNSCGDTEILGFVTTPSEFSIQLKPIFIPEAKASAFQDEAGQLLVFPVTDVLLFLQELGVYTIEIFVKNTCGIGEEAISLKPFPLELTNGEQG